MRLIKKYSDYYDGAATLFGQEPVYVRESNVSPADYNFQHRHVFFLDLTWKSKEGLNTGLTDTYVSIIFFCGKYYEVYYTRPHIFKDMEFHSYKVIPRPERFPETFPCPIAVRNSSWTHKGKPEWIHNPRLTLYDFQKVFDPYTAAQEIDMWLTNQAQPIEIPLKVDDITKIKSHGFDVKKSFRKDKKQ